MGLKYLPKLTKEHFQLTLCSVMNVRLAVQVLSFSIGKVLQEFGPPDGEGTAKFCILMDSLFDCFNVRNTEEFIRKRKPNLKPYSDPQDEPFDWLKNDFLKFFKDWKNSIENRPGNFSKQAKSSMFLAWQTYESLLITVNSFMAVCKYLLIDTGFSYILSEKFCQDHLENCFGKQCRIRRRRDNPNVRSVGYIDHLIKAQYSVNPIAGNVRGDNSKWNDITAVPLKKRKADI